MGNDVYSAKAATILPGCGDFPPSWQAGDPCPQGFPRLAAGHYFDVQLEKSTLVSEETVQLTARILDSDGANVTDFGPGSSAERRACKVRVNVVVFEGPGAGSVVQIKKSTSTEYLDEQWYTLSYYDVSNLDKTGFQDDVQFRLDGAGQAATILLKVQFPCFLDTDGTKINGVITFTLISEQLESGWLTGGSSSATAPNTNPRVSHERYLHLSDTRIAQQDVATGNERTRAASAGISDATAGANLYVMGGTDSSEVVSKLNQVYVVGQDVWVGRTDLLFAHYNLAAAYHEDSLDGDKDKIYVLGGLDSAGAYPVVADHWRYDPSASSWSLPMALPDSMPQSHTYVSVGVPASSYYSIRANGGNTSGSTIMEGNFSYSSLLDSWAEGTAQGPTYNPPRRHTAASRDSAEALHIIGGYLTPIDSGTDVESSAHVMYIQNENAWSLKVGYLGLVGISDSSAVTLAKNGEDLIYLLGGRTSATAAIDSIASYSETTLAWKTEPASLTTDRLSAVGSVA